MEKEGYLKRTEEIVIQKGTELHWTLEPNFGWLDVTSTPAGLDVRVNDVHKGQTPILGVELPPGTYEVVVGDRCYFLAGKRVGIARGQRKTVEVAPKPRQGAIDVSAEDKKGNAVDAEVFVGGAKVGRAPGTFATSICSKEIEVRHEEHDSWSKQISVAEKQTLTLRAVLEPKHRSPPYGEGASRSALNAIQTNSKNPIVEIKTSKGSVVAEIFRDKAPISAQNFMEYVDAKFYDGTIFHRVINHFMIQGGGFDKMMKQKDARAPIRNEASNGLSNQPGTLAMARTNDPNSATSQFFINTADNKRLDYTGQGPMGAGYAVFGRVLSGMDVVRKIEASKTTISNGMSDVPVTMVIIESIRKVGK
jgi:cyclophilin family peptidyl-prolyl cis-trans isomerase